MTFCSWTDRTGHAAGGCLLLLCFAASLLALGSRLPDCQGIPYANGRRNVEFAGLFSAHICARWEQQGLANYWVCTTEAHPGQSHVGMPVAFSTSNSVLEDAAPRA
jgi:hypothetical protein